MVGIIKSQMQAQGQQEAPAEEGGARVPSGGQQGASAVGDEQATPEEQQAYDKVVLAALQFIHDEKTHPAVVKSLKDLAADPAAAIGTTAFNILIALDEKSGGQIPGEVLVPAALEIMNEVAELARAMKLFQVDEALLAKGVQNMVALAIERGVISPEDVEALMGEMAPEEVEALRAEQESIAGGQSGQSAAAVPQGETA